MKFKNLAFAVLALILVATACGGTGASPSSSNTQESNCSGYEDLRIVSDTNGALYLDGKDGLVTQFEKAENKSICVDYVGGPEAQRIKADILSKKADNFSDTDYHAMIFDSAIYAENLSDQVFFGKTYPGIWLRKDVSEKLGLQPGQILTQEQYAKYMEGGLKMITASALINTAASLTFFNTMSGYYGPYNQLTLEQVQDEGARAFGQRIYNYYTKSNSDPIKLAFDDNISGQNLYDGVVAFESAFLGKDGLNQQLVNSGKQPFIFFYFNPSVEAKATIGRAPSIPDDALVTYSLFTQFLTSETSQAYMLTVGVHPQKNVADPDPSIFKAEWGLLTSPTIDFAAPPTPSVARAALEIYRDYYKRAKEVDLIIDNSGSTTYPDVVITLPANFAASDLNQYCGLNESYDELIRKDQRYVAGQPFEYSITRAQAIACGVETFSNSGWMAANGVKSGPNDVINYWLFNDTTTANPIISSVGPNTDEAGQFVVNLLGSAHNQPDLNAVANEINSKFSPFVAFQGTRMFDASYIVNEQINARYDPNVDYYLVVLTDGENMNGWSGRDYYDYWFANQKLNITLTGIQFGGSGEDLTATYTQQFGGDSFVGTNPEQLVNAFEKIFGN